MDIQIKRVMEAITQINNGIYPTFHPKMREIDVVKLTLLANSSHIREHETSMFKRLCVIL